MRRNSRVGQLVVDSGVEAMSGTSPGTFSSLNVNSGYLFVGGIPTLVASSTFLPQVVV